MMNSYTGPMMLMPKQAAEATGCSVYMIRRLIREDVVKYVKSGRRHYINMPSLMEYLSCEQNE